MTRLLNAEGTSAQHRMLLWLARVCALVAITAASADLLLGARQLLHSDTAVKSVLALQAVWQGRLLPEAWTYSNGDLLTVNPYLFALPLTWLFGVNLTSNAVAGWMGYAAMVLAAGCLIRRVAAVPLRDDAGGLVALALVASTLSVASFEFIVRQGAYSVYAAAVLLLLWAVLSRGDRRNSALACVLAALLASSNPTRAATLVFAPVLLALLADAISPSRSAADASRWQGLVSRTVAGMLVGALLGSLAYHFLLMPRLDNYLAAANVGLPTRESVSVALARIVPDAMAYAAAGPQWPLASPGQRLFQLAIWALWLAALLVPCAILLQRGMPALQRRLAWTGAAMFCAGVLPLIFANGLYTSRSEFRYASLGVLVAWILLGTTLGRRVAERRTGSGILLAGAALLAMSSALAWNVNRPLRNPSYEGMAQQSPAIVDYLRQARAGTAAATYWNSHVLSVLSDAGVLVNPINPTGQGFARYPSLAPLRPLRGGFGPRHAVILTQEETASASGMALQQQLGEPLRRETFGPFVVSVYETPVVDDLYGVEASRALPFPPRLRARQHP